MLTSQSTRSTRLERADFAGQRLGERVELLAERHRHGVLQLRPPHLQDRGELAGPSRGTPRSAPCIAATSRMLPSAMPTCSAVG